MSDFEGDFVSHDYENEMIPEMVEGSALRVLWLEHNGKAGSEVAYVDGDINGHHYETRLRISSGSPTEDVLDRVEYEGDREISRRPATRDESMALFNSLFDERLEDGMTGFLQKVIRRKVVESEFLPKLSPRGVAEYGRLLNEMIWDEVGTPLPDSPVIDSDLNVIDANLTGYQALVHDLLQKFPNTKTMEENQLLQHLIDNPAKKN